MEDELLNAADAAVEDAIVEEETATVLHADALAKAEAAAELAAAAEELAAEAVVEEAVAEELDDMAAEDTATAELLAEAADKETDASGFPSRSARLEARPAERLDADRGRGHRAHRPCPRSAELLHQGGGQRPPIERRPDEADDERPRLHPGWREPDLRHLPGVPHRCERHEHHHAVLHVGHEPVRRHPGKGVAGTEGHPPPGRPADRLHDVGVMSHDQIIASLRRAVRDPV